MNKEIIAILEYLEREKGVKRENILAAIEEAIVEAARKSVKGASNVTVRIDPKSGDIEIFCEKMIVDEVEVPSIEISLEEARELDPDCEIGQYIDIQTTPPAFGRVAAQKARQVINQKLREAERDVIYKEYRDRVGELLSGTVKKIARGNNLIIDLGKVEGVLPGRFVPKTEKFHVTDRVLALLFAVNETEHGGAEVVLSRTHNQFVESLIEQEVPEIQDGTVSLVKIVRQPGYRTKIAVDSSDFKVDPVGACVGVRGTRIKNVIRELHNEKIDVIPYSSDPVELLKNSLAPIEIRHLTVTDQRDDKNQGHLEISIVVDDEAYPSVLGKKGMNIWLNSELIEAKVSVKKMSEYMRAVAMERMLLADSDDPTLDLEIVEIEGVSNLLVRMIAEKFPTRRELLSRTPDEIVEQIPELSLKLAVDILEKLRKERV